MGHNYNDQMDGDEVDDTEHLDEEPVQLTVKHAECQTEDSTEFSRNTKTGDIVLADKGFSRVTTLFSERNAILIMPAFANPGEPQFSVESMNETCKIARVRVHVERIIQRLKIYDILNHRIPLDLLPHMDQVMRFIGVLVNLQSDIVKKTK